MDLKKILIGIPLYAVAVCALIYPALLNGFPLLYTDSVTYLYCGFENKVPIDRPIMYCLFTRYTSLGFSCWFTIIAQSLLTVHLSFLFVKHYCRIPNPIVWNTVIILVLSIGTGLSNFASQLMPDLFTPLLIPATLLLFNYKNLSYANRVFLILVILLCASVHFSNVLLLTSVFVTYWIIIMIRNKKFAAPAYVPLAVFLISWIAIPLVNLKKTDKFYYSDAGYIFTTGSLASMGVLHYFVTHYGDEAPAAFRAKKEMLKEMDHAELLWTDSSPLYDSMCKKDGGWENCWKVRNKELKKMIGNMFSHAEVRGMIFEKSLEAFGRQFTDFEIGHLIPMKDNTNMHNVFNSRLPNDVPAFLSCTQQNDTLFFPEESKVQFSLILVFLVIIAGGIILAFLRKGFVNPTWFDLLILVAVLVVANAAVCGILSNPVNRYQARVIWLVPYFGMLSVAARGAFLKKSVAHGS